MVLHQGTKDTESEGFIVTNPGILIDPRGVFMRSSFVYPGNGDVTLYNSQFSYNTLLYSIFEQPKVAISDIIGLLASETVPR